MRADNYALSEDAKRQRDLEQTNLTERAYAEALRILTKHRALLDRVANALLEKETLSRKELLEIFGDVQPESRASEAVGSCGCSAPTRRWRALPIRPGKREMSIASSGVSTSNACSSREVIAPLVALALDLQREGLALGRDVERAVLRRVGPTRSRWCR